MGYFDAENLYCGDPLTKEGQQMLASGVSDNVIDHQCNNIGPGEPIMLCIQVKEDFDAGSLTVALETAAGEGFLTAVTLVTTGDIDAADLVAGYKFPPIAVPRHTLRYTRLNFTVTGTPTTGAIWAGLQKDTEDWYAHPSNVGS